MLKETIKQIKYLPVWAIYRRNTFVREELQCWCQSLRIDKGSEFKNFCFLMKLPEYRSVLYWRLNLRTLIQKIAPPHTVLYISTANNKVGKGFVIEHGHSTVIHANSIGENCHIWQNVTIGKKWPGGSKPNIGNNVFVCTGAVVLGDVLIGNDVVIGANAVVTKSVPNNCVVAGNPAKIIRRNGQRVNEEL